jgi:uncharacterized protein (DUF1501 family)
MISRRAFLGRGVAGASFVSLAGAMPRLFARAAEDSARADANDHVLVVVELQGGNDGLNTVIPFEDPLYYKNRRTLGIGKKEVRPLSKQVGLHPKMGTMAELFKEGRLAVIQGAGYPQPDRSHFRSMEIWHTASLNARPPDTGWLGRYLDASLKPGEDNVLRGLDLTGSLAQAFQAEKSVVPVIGQLEALTQAEQDDQAKAALTRSLSGLRNQASSPIGFLRKQATATYAAADHLKQAAGKYKTGAQYPDGELSAQLHKGAQILSARLGVRVLFASLGGFDTHAGQAESHSNLLEQLSGALGAFDNDLKRQGLSDKVIVLAFSEFGRRVDENASRGTDHGAASCLFLSGARVKGGLVGQYPSLEKLGEGDLIYSTDFRSVYATILEDWLGCPAEATLGTTFPKLGLIS